MYIFPDMIDMGLKDGQSWPSDAHRVVASRLGLSNSRVTTRDALTELCQAVIAIPQDRIETVTHNDCAIEFKVPFIPVQS